MSYNKTVWQSGDTITAEKLNKIEDALAALLNSSSQEAAQPDPIAAPAEPAEPSAEIQ